MNNTVYLKKYPEIQRAINLITAPTVSPSYQPYQVADNMPVEGEEKDISQVQEVILTPIEQKMQNDAKIISDVKERILPIESQEVIYQEPVILNEVEKQPTLVQPLQPIKQQESEVLPVGGETTLPDVSEKITDPNVVVLSPEMPKNIDANQLLEEEIILEDIPLPVDGVVPASEEVQVEPTTSKTDVQIRDVSFKYDQADEEPRLFVQGVVSNITERVIKMPPLQVQLFDSNAALLGVKDLPYGDAQMPAKSDEFFFYELTDIPAGTVAKIEVVVKG
jgi:hypothetical protein